MRVALYARVSTVDQGQNPETQLYRLREIARARGWEIYKEYVDFASGKNPDRPQFKVLMEDAKQHRFDMIFVTRIDRVMRSTKNLFNVLEELEHYHVGFECSEQEISTKGAIGKLTLTILSGIAEFERDLILERSKEGTARAKAEGKLCHRPKGSKDSKKRKSRKGASKTPPSLLSDPGTEREEVRNR
jgi:DNA invertase Pin-like site-specific DNA recombinase